MLGPLGEERVRLRDCSVALLDSLERKKNKQKKRRTSLGSGRSVRGARKPHDQIRAWRFLQASLVMERHNCHRRMLRLH